MNNINVPVHTAVPGVRMLDYRERSLAFQVNIGPNAR